MDELKRAADAAHALGTKKVRIFTFLRVADPDTIFDRIVDELHKAIVGSQRAGCGAGCRKRAQLQYRHGHRNRQVIQRGERSTLMHNWDPGNCFEAGEEPFPKGWNMLDHNRIIHVHLKDAAGKDWKPIGAGEIDFIGQFKALKDMQFTGQLSLETHYRNAAHNAYASSVESMDGLFSVLRKV